MAATHEAAKTVTPAYGSFKTLVGFANSVREGGHVPMQIDRTLMSNLSGSGISETITSLKFLGLAVGDKPLKPSVAFESFAMASDEQRPDILRKILLDSYGFLWSAPDFDIERASSQQVTDLFRQQGVNGTTLVKAISFFLSAAKEAGIKVSHNVKAPKLVPTGSKVKKEKRVEIAPAVPAIETPRSPAVEHAMPGTNRFELPIPGKPSVLVIVPDTLDAEDWDMVSQMFGIYVSRWKGYKANGQSKEGVDA